LSLSISDTPFQATMQPHTGILEVSSRADGRLRTLDKTLISSPNDPVVPGRLIERFQIRPGLLLEVELGGPAGGQGGGNGHPQRESFHHRGKHRQKLRPKLNAIAPSAPRVQQVVSIDGHAPEDYLKRRRF
jgi:hypothetical protein